VVAYYEISPKITIEPMEYIYPSNKDYQNGVAFTGRQYVKTYDQLVTAISSNGDYAAVLFHNGKAILHPLNDEYFNNNLDGLSLPTEEEKITHLFMTTTHLVYATSGGIIVHMDLEELAPIANYKHQVRFFNIGGIQIYGTSTRHRKYDCIY
jgi:hypothetical protein